MRGLALAVLAAIVAIVAAVYIVGGGMMVYMAWSHPEIYFQNFGN